MQRLFISHSSKDNDPAKRFAEWLAGEGWADTFLDVDPHQGLAPGQRWREELKKAGEKAAAVFVLISPHWAASKWCLTEYLFALQLGKLIFPVLIAPTDFATLPPELTATFQIADLSDATTVAAAHEAIKAGMVRAGLHPNAFPWPPEDPNDRAVYRGFRAINTEHAAIFFGRDTQITNGMDTLRLMRDGGPERILVILGASGAGKSSFLRAGLIARLRRDEERFLVLPTVRPSQAAMTGASGLGRALGFTGTADRAALIKRFAAMRAPVVARFGELAKTLGQPALKPPTIILPVDQAEELFVAGDKEANAAVNLIAEAIAADHDVIVIATIRSDSFNLMQADRRISAIPLQTFSLPPLPKAAYLDIINKPGALAEPKTVFERQLVEQLIADFDDADALPLLAFTLERLVADYGEDGLVRLAEYETMKGLEGAVRKAVSAAFETAENRLPNLSRRDLEDITRRVFVPALVSIDAAASAPKRRVALRNDLPANALPVVDCFTSQRLLVTKANRGEAGGNAADGEPTVEVAHEALFNHWRDLQRWIRDRRDDLVLADKVREAADAWAPTTSDEGGGTGGKRAARTADDLLVHWGDRLIQAEKLIATGDLFSILGPNAKAYLKACREAERRRRRFVLRVVQGSVAAALMLAVLVGVTVWQASEARWSTEIARKNEIEARENFAALLEQLAKNALTTGNYRPLKLSLASQSAHPDAIWPRTIEESVIQFAQNGKPPYPEMDVRNTNFLIAKIGGNYLHHAKFLDDNLRVFITRRKGAELLKIDPEEVIRSIPGEIYGFEWTGMDISPDGGSLFSVSGVARASLPQIIDLEGIKTPIDLDGHEGPVWAGTFSSDGSRIVTTSSNVAMVWAADTGKRIGVLAESHTKKITDAVFSHDGDRIVTSFRDGSAHVWKIDGDTPIPLLGHEAVVHAAAFSRDGKLIVTASADRTARLWDSQTGDLLHVFEGHREAVRDVVFSPDDTLIVTASADGIARIWDAKERYEISRLAAHHGSPVHSVDFSPDGRLIVTASDYGAMIWSAVPVPKESWIREVCRRMSPELVDLSQLETELGLSSMDPICTTEQIDTPLPQY